MNAINKINTTAATVDQLGSIKAQLAALAVIEKALVAQLKENGDGVYAGASYDANIFTNNRETLDSAAVRAYFSRTPAGRRWLKAHTNVSSVTTCKVTARVRRD